MGVQILAGMGTFEGRYVPAHGNVPTAVKCACPTHAADECIRRRKGWQDGDAASYQITFDTVLQINTKESKCYRHVN